MTEVYGGLLLENIRPEDPYLDLQLRLFEEGLISGVQVRVAHPSFTPGLNDSDLAGLFGALPAGFELFFHLGAESVGVDPGECLDEQGVYRRNSEMYRNRWAVWNEQTWMWGIQAAKIAFKGGRIPSGIPYGVCHPGYGSTPDDSERLSKTVRLLQCCEGSSVTLENVPPIVSRESHLNHGDKCAAHWDLERYWGFGGTPGDMRRLLGALGPGWKCLLDFTHLVVAVNQANYHRLPELAAYRDLDTTLRGYLDLPHSCVCHFSGIPNTLVDDHDFLDVLPPPSIRDALREMRVVCLEISWRPREPEEVIRQVESFRRAYVE